MPPEPAQEYYNVRTTDGQRMRRGEIGEGASAGAVSLIAGWSWRMQATDLAQCIHAQKFVEQVRAEMGSDSAVKDGKFGAMMAVDICNDGPVTMQIEYPGNLGSLGHHIAPAVWRAEAPILGARYLPCAPACALPLHRIVTPDAACCVLGQQSRQDRKRLDAKMTRKRGTRKGRQGRRHNHSQHRHG